MTPETKKKCEEVMALVGNGMSQQAAIKKIGIGSATIRRYKVSMQTSKPSPVVQDKTSSPKPGEKPKITSHTKKQESPNEKTGELIKKLLFENEKLKRENMMLRKVSQELLSNGDSYF